MKILEIMNRAKFVRQGAGMVFVCDLSGLEPDDVRSVVSRSRDIISRMPANSVHMLMNLSGIRDCGSTKMCTRELLKEVGPHLYKGAVSGLADILEKAVWEGALSVARKDLGYFATYEDALCWLVEPRAA